MNAMGKGNIVDMTIKPATRNDGGSGAGVIPSFTNLPTSAPGDSGLMQSPMADAHTQAPSTLVQDAAPGWDTSIQPDHYAPAPVKPNPGDTVRG